MFLDTSDDSNQLNKVNLKKQQPDAVMTNQDKSTLEIEYGSNSILFHQTIDQPNNQSKIDNNQIIQNEKQSNKKQEKDLKEMNEQQK